MIVKFQRVGSYPCLAWDYNGSNIICPKWGRELKFPNRDLIFEVRADPFEGATMVESFDSPDYSDREGGAPLYFGGQFIEDSYADSIRHVLGRANCTRRNGIIRGWVKEIGDEKCPACGNPRVQ